MIMETTFFTHQLWKGLFCVLFFCVASIGVQAQVICEGESIFLAEPPQGPQGPAGSNCPPMCVNCGTLSISPSENTVPLSNGFEVSPTETTTYTITRTYPGGPGSPPCPSESITYTVEVVDCMPPPESGLDAGLSVFVSPIVHTGDFAQVIVRLHNYGTETWESVTINWSVNGVSQIPYVLQGFPMAPGSSYDLTIGSIYLDGKEGFTIEAYTSNPNGMADANPSNDAITMVLEPTDPPEEGTADAGIIDFLSPLSSASGYSLVQVTLSNLGSSSLSSTTINWSVNGEMQTPYYYTGPTLAPGQSINLYIGSYFFADMTYTIEVWTSQPNDKADANPDNDSITYILNASGNLYNLDAGIEEILEPTTLLLGYHLVRVRLTNYGMETLNSVDILWSVNGEAQTPYYYNGPPLSCGQSIELYIGSYFFEGNQSYTIEVTTDNPNGGLDDNPGNDGEDVSF